MTKKTESIGIMSAEIAGADGEFQLFPDGEFKAKDGRPNDAPAYVMDETIAKLIIEAFNKLKTPLVVDYEHQTLSAKDNGKPAPAAGWINGLEWRPGKGLYATNVEWTESARDAIKANEYRYISPVFSYRLPAGDISKLHHAALTNNPAIDGMEAVTALSLQLQAGKIQPGEIDACEEKRAALTLEIARAQTELAALTERSAALKAEHEALTLQHTDERITRMVDGYVEAGMIYPFERNAYLTLARVNMPALQEALAPRASFNWMQCQSARTGTAQIAAAAKPLNLNAGEIRACELTGRSHEEFAALKNKYSPDQNPVHL
ncbi:hypothetical protein AGMMS49545_10440 [Betaproteobacteria bacterium]|nr:hypothetical protein AGMMS49545_10440 [Betaproteobacteria bacterium]GHU44373.1 hypothetical protein AGMMS50289_12520 [Betaproteobacteria bacterium]